MSAAPRSPLRQAAPKLTIPQIVDSAEDIEIEPQYVEGLTELDAQTRPLALLDFGDGSGTSGKLNRIGELAQLKKLVMTDHKIAACRLATAEPRSIQYPNANPSGQGYEEDENPKTSSYYERMVPHKQDQFTQLASGSSNTHGFGLRLDGVTLATTMTNLKTYYRNDKHPEVRYTVKDKANVLVRAVVHEGQVVQQLSLTSIASGKVELDLLFDLSVALDAAPYDRLNLEENNISPERSPEKVFQTHVEGQTQWVIRQEDFHMSVVLYRDGKVHDISIESEDGVPADSLPPTLEAQLIHKETIQLAPRQTVEFTAVFKQSAGTEFLESPLHLVEIDKITQIEEPNMWWRFSGGEEESFLYRRSLEVIITAFMPIPNQPPEKIGDLEIYPGTFHDHDAVDYGHIMEYSLDQAHHLIIYDRFLSLPNAASENTVKHYRAIIRKIVLGFLVYVARGTQNIWKHPWVYGKSWFAKERRDAIHEYALRIAKGRVLKPGGTIDECLGALALQEAANFAEASPDMIPPIPPPPPPPPQSSPAEQEEQAKLADQVEQSEIGSLREAQLGNSATLQAPANDDDAPDPEADSALWTVFIGPTQHNRRPAAELIRLIEASVERFAAETTTLLKGRLRRHLEIAWEKMKETQNASSHLWPDFFWQKSDTGNAYYVKSVTDVHCYSVAANVNCWKAVRAMERLVAAFPNDKLCTAADDPKFLDSSAIRQRIFEHFVESPPNEKPRMILRREGHVKFYAFSGHDYILLNPAENESFFIDNNVYHPAWIETLENGTYMFNAEEESSSGIEMNRNAELVRYLLANATTKVGQFRKDKNISTLLDLTEKTTACNFTGVYTVDDARTRIWFKLISRTMMIDYPEITANLNAASSARALRQQKGEGAKQGDSRTNSRGANKHGAHTLTTTDREMINNPPTYGQYVWYPVPKFYSMNLVVSTSVRTGNIPSLIQEIQKCLDPKHDDFWAQNLSYCWGSEKEIRRYINHLDIDRAYSDPVTAMESMYMLIDHSYAMERGELKPITKFGRDMLQRYTEDRFFAGSKKRLIYMRHCRLDQLLLALSPMHPDERIHNAVFLNRLMDTDSHKMEFAQRTLMPENIWVHEFNINFIAFLIPQLNPEALDEGKSKHFAPKKRSRMISINPTVAPESLPVLTDGVFGFRFSGDLHDRFWTGLSVMDLGYITEREAKFGLDYRSGPYYEEIKKRWRQRKVVEGLLVLEAMNIVLRETERIMDYVDDEMEGARTKSKSKYEPILSAVLTAEDLSGENYFVTMNKHSVYYPWVLQLCNTLRDKCEHVNETVKKWLNADQVWQYKPRWSENDQIRYGEQVANNNRQVRARLADLDLLIMRIHNKHSNVSTLKESLASELSLREARTATQQANSIGLFTVVTVVFLPLSFATSILGIQDFGWSRPLESLLTIAIPTTVGTLLFLINLPIIYRYFNIFIETCQRWLRRRMVEDTASWDFWEEKSRSLREAEKRSTLLKDDTLHGSETNWWYWHFFLVFILLGLPVRELRFANEVIHNRKMPKVGILKKILRVPFAPLWMTILLIDYIVLLFCCIIKSTFVTFGKGLKWLWQGPEESEDYDDTKSIHSKSDQGTDSSSNVMVLNRNGTGLDFPRVSMDGTRLLLRKTKKDHVPIWKRPINIMKLGAVLVPKKDSDIEAPLTGVRSNVSAAGTVTEQQHLAGK